ncbi:hypothetical protein FrCorBMG51_05185 [Protofrankia coriariae]|uniref:Uncharacterized protein n=1 Tax=Protofrankia coriariae TaxID=1562887 RepID=A0ABR5F6P0_9ACTN|nr:hypothetical protein FrCorBMG51_05185 [Protofrankia coriariae]
MKPGGEARTGISKHLPGSCTRQRVAHVRKRRGGLPDVAVCSRSTGDRGSLSSGNRTDAISHHPPGRSAERLDVRP